MSSPAHTRPNAIALRPRRCVLDKMSFHEGSIRNPLWCINRLPERPIFRSVYQTIRTEAGMPSLVIRLSTLHPIFASVR